MMALLDKSRVEIKLGPYVTAPATALADPTLLPRVQDYRRQLSARMYPLDKEAIHERIAAADYHASRKIDGEFTVLVFRQGEICTINPGGTVRVGMPWLEEAASLLSQAGVKEALIAGELYVAPASEEDRPRVHHVTKLARLPRSSEDIERLRFAVFDILSLVGVALEEPFAETWRRIERIFHDGDRVHPVEAKPAKNSADVEKLFHRWVEEEGAEGVVVRSDTAGMFKVKPRHTLDAAVIGFTESLQERQGLLHDLLLAVMRQDGAMQVLSRVGGGFSDDERRAMLSDLKDMVVESEYVEVNKDHVAYQMVRPDWVVEISCLDLISQTTRGGPVNRMVLDWHEQNGSSRYNVVRRLPLAAVISPQFVRRREDKRIVPQDIRITQVSDLVEVPLVEQDAREMKLPPSELLRREVYTKAAKGETMVRKFVMWKTNKQQQSENFPAYVVHYTDFSPNRKAPLAREVRVSSSLDQINALFDGFKADNIKKGWQPESVAEEAMLPVESRTAGEPPVAATAHKQQEETPSPELVSGKKPTKKTIARKEEAPKKKAGTTGKKKPAKKKSAKKKSAKTSKKAATGKKKATKKTPKQAAAKKKGVKMAPSEREKDEAAQQDQSTKKKTG